MNDFDNKQICSYKDIDSFGFTCDVCGRKVNGCHYINGMKFCAKCYQETFGKDNQQNEIQQLKQQLKEKDKEEVVVTERGWAGHYCASDYCKFRRNTLIEYQDKKWIVSTVGAMPANKYSFNKNENGFTMIGLCRYYETKAFEAQKHGIYWDANVTKEIGFNSKWALNECNFNSDQKANEMHDKVVEELIKKIKGE